jgi:hypothetical protein
MRRTFLLFLLFILCFVSTSTALAEVQVRLRVIGASNDGQTIDPSLKDIYKELRSLFSFTSYRLFRDENLTLSPNQPVSISTRRGRLIEVTLISLHKDIAELRIRVVREEKEILNTQVRLFPVIIYALYARF